MYVHVPSQRYVFNVELYLCTLSCRFILRNHILQTAIEQAEKGDYSEVYPLLHIYIRACVLVDPQCLKPANQHYTYTCTCIMTSIIVHMYNIIHVGTQAHGTASNSIYCTFLYATNGDY